MSDDAQARRFIESQKGKITHAAFPKPTLRDYIASQQRSKEKKKPRRRGMDPENPLEHTEQATLVKWAFLYRKQIPQLANLFAIPNQGAARLKQLQTEGVLKGVSDLFLAVSRIRDRHSEIWSHGLFIEMKRVKKFKVSGEQIDFMARMQTAGYEVVIAHGAEEAWTAILKYLQVKDPRR